MTEETQQPWKSEEWVMVGTSAPQNFYVGKVEISAEEMRDQLMIHPDLKDASASEILRSYVRYCIAARMELKLVDARMLLTMVQMVPGKGLQMGTQLLPISCSFAPATLYIAPTLVILPGDVPKMIERITELADELEKQEFQNRAAAANIQLTRVMPGRTQ